MKLLDAVRARIDRFLRLLALGRAPRVVLGAASTSYPGWASTDRDTLDVTSRRSFRALWRPGTRAAFLAEHVWEHLSPEDALLAARNCREFLAVGGRLRIAVPDGFHPDPGYIEQVRPGGSGAGADDHKALYTHETLSALLERAGFEVALLEYWDRDGRFHSCEWSPGDGPVHRSSRNDPRNREGGLAYTSIIADGYRRS